MFLIFPLKTAVSLAVDAGTYPSCISAKAEYTLDELSAHCRALSEYLWFGTLLQGTSAELMLQFILFQSHFFNEKSSYQ